MNKNEFTVESVQPLPQKSESKFPTSKQLEKELMRTSGGGSNNPIKTILTVLVVSAAVIILLTTVLFPVIKISGSSMQPTLKNEDVALTVKTSKLKRGDICYFYNNNNLMVRRVIGVTGDVINIDEYGTVFVNDEQLDENYITEKNLGIVDISFPYTVPERMYFVMGDNRPAAKDSRHAEVGCVSVDVVVGKLLVNVWPVYSIGIVK